jgi:hypothetical protein
MSCFSVHVNGFQDSLSLLHPAFLFIKTAQTDICIYGFYEKRHGKYLLVTAAKLNEGDNHESRCGK